MRRFNWLTLTWQILAICLISPFCLVSYCSAQEYITNMDLNFTSCGSGTSEFVDIITYTGGTRTFSASGYLSGTLQQTIAFEAAIQGGTYAGWRYSRGTYELAGYSGTVYHIFNDNTGEVWGSTTGDIHAAVRSGEWHITSANNAQVTGTINLANEISIAGTPTTISNTVVSSRPGFIIEGTASGYYNGPWRNDATSINISALFPDSGFSLTTYITDIGTGNGWTYKDDRFGTARYSTWDGPFEGIGSKTWIGTCPDDPPLTQQNEHVLSSSSSSTTKVPVHNGLWLIPSILTGFYLLRRRKS